MKNKQIFIFLVVYALVLSSCEHRQKVTIEGYTKDKTVAFHFDENSLKEKNIYSAQLFFKGEIADSLIIVGLKTLNNLNLKINSGALDTNFRFDKYNLEPLKLIVNSKSDENWLSITCALYY